MMMSCYYSLILTLVILSCCVSFSLNSNNNYMNPNAESKLIAASVDADANHQQETLGIVNKNIVNSNNNKVTSNKLIVRASHAVFRQSCYNSSDCNATSGSICDLSLHQCKCARDFVAVGKFSVPMNHSLSQVQLPQCHSMAKLNQLCIGDEQCVVRHSVCVFDHPRVGSFGNVSKHSVRHQCKCEKGYQEEEGEERIDINGQVIINSPICRAFVSIGNSWIGPLTIVSLMLVILLIGCFIGIVRFQRWKQRPLATTVTSLAASMGQTPHLIPSSPPPMGSVEAEFQNDFIQVFPMHHLEPLPDKNSTHYVIK